MNKEMYTVIGVGVALAAILITSLSGVRAEVASLRTEVRDGQTALHTEMREGQTALRTEVREGQTALRTEMREGQTALRTEMQENHAMLHAELVDVRTGVGQLGERVARLEATLGVPPGDPAAAEQ